VTNIERVFVSTESPTAPRAGFGARPLQGLYHRPAAGPPPTTAFLATHYDLDFSEHYLAEFLAARGFGFLGWNTRYRGNGTYFSLANAVADIGVGAQWLRREAGVERVVILGNSGGASLMAAYQAQATGTDRADLFISLCAHPGRPDVLTAWIDASVTDESDPLSVDSSLDLFDHGNGPPYSAEFVARYRDGQAARNDRITDWCHAELARLAEHGGWDRTFSVYRVWADPRFLDLSLDPSDREVGCYFGDPRRANYGAFGIGGVNTCRSWLDMWSLRDSPCRAEPHLAKITEPALVVQSTADQGCYPSDARAIHEALGSADKRLEWVPGDHYLLDPPTGRDDVADLITAWVTAH
jgi:pimeloyl-ACP methyl ester carboxylesterase